MTLRRGYLLVAALAVALVACAPEPHEAGTISPFGRHALLEYAAELDVLGEDYQLSPTWEDADVIIFAPPETAGFDGELPSELRRWWTEAVREYDDGVEVVWIGSLEPWIDTVSATQPRTGVLRDMEGERPPPRVPIHHVYDFATDRSSESVQIMGETYTFEPVLRDAEGGVVMAYLENDDFVMLCVSDPVLLSNVMLLHPENDTWLELMIPPNESVILVERPLDGEDPLDDSSTRWKAFLALHGLAFWLFLLWARGAVVIRYPSWVRVPRRSRTEHASALGRRLRRLNHHETALRIYARWAMEELRQRAAGRAQAGRVDLSELMTELSRRSGLDVAEVIRRWHATQRSLDLGEVDAPERIAELHDLLQRIQRREQ